MKQYSLILFDLDGTLTDPMVGITSGVQYALAHFGIDEPNRENLTKFIGPPLHGAFVEFYGFDDEKAKLAIKKYREYFTDKGIFENEIYEGILPLLQNLKKQGKMVAVASSKPYVFVKRILEHFKIDGFFDVVGGSELDGTRVEKEEVISYVIKRCEALTGGKIALSQVVMIGDRAFDVAGGKTLGIDTIGVSYGFGGREELECAGARYIADSVSALHTLLLL